MATQQPLLNKTLRHHARFLSSVIIHFEEIDRFLASRFRRHNTSFPYNCLSWRLSKRVARWPPTLRTSTSSSNATLLPRKLYHQEHLRLHGSRQISSHRNGQHLPRPAAPSGYAADVDKAEKLKDTKRTSSPGSTTESESTASAGSSGSDLNPLASTFKPGSVSIPPPIATHRTTV